MGRNAVITSRPSSLLVLRPLSLLRLLLLLLLVLFSTLARFPPLLQKGDFLTSMLRITERGRETGLQFEPGARVLEPKIGLTGVRFLSCCKLSDLFIQLRNSARNS